MNEQIQESIHNNDNNESNTFETNGQLNQGTNENTNESSPCAQNLNFITQTMNVEEETINQNLSCANCKRHHHQYLIDTFGLESPYSIHFTTKQSSEIHNRKFKHRDIVTNDSELEYNLCIPCSHYLTLTTNYNKNNYCWPSFYIKLLENTTIHSKYKNKIWKFVPIQFRYWWLSYLHERYPHVYSNVSIKSPLPFFKEVSRKVNKWKESISSGELPRLAESCNEMLIPTILCPWGESVFIHKCGSLPIDIIIQRYIQYCEITLMNDANMLSRVKWARDDFIRDEDSQDALLLNPKWKVSPSIAFIDGCPRVLTCEDHNNGTKDMMIHTCRLPHCLPCAQPDQIAQVVVQSRTIRQGKASAYSTEWQMFEQKGHFSGLDTCNHVEFGNFDNRSRLRFEIEDRSIHNRYDINAHLDKLCRHGIISSETVTNMRNSANENANEDNYKKLTKGATYVPLKDAISYQEDSKDRIISINGNQTANENEGDQIRFSRYWPKSLYPCQNLSSHGCQMLHIPSFQGGLSNKKLWQISAIATQNEDIWNLLIKSITYMNDWKGWLLSYLSKNCLNMKRKSGRKDPFKVTQIRTINQLLQKIPSNRNLTIMMNEVKRVRCLSVNSFQKEEIESTIASSLNNNDEFVILTSDGLLNDTFEDARSYIEKLNINEGISLELRTLIITNHPNASINTWKGHIYSRHGNQFCKYWYQERGSKFPIKKRLRKDLAISDEVILVFKRIQIEHFNSYRNRYLKLIGGQTHVRCETHKLPLIVSYNKKRVCTECGTKRSKYCCTNEKCNVCLCQQCFKSFSEKEFSFLNTNNNGNSGMDEDFVSIQQEDSESENEDNLERVLTEEDIENYVTVSEEHNLLVDDSELLNADLSEEDENNDVDFIPTTNAGEVALQIDEKVNYGFKFSGSNILNNAGALLTRKSTTIEKSRYVCHYLQKMSSVTNCNSIPLLYPEGTQYD